MMKRIFGLFAFTLFLGVVGLNAQENVNPETAAATEVKKSCSKKCSKTCEAKASKAADMSDNIEKKVCPVTGNVSYQRKNVNPETGEVSYTGVRYDETTATFVDLKNDANSDSHGMTQSATSSKKSCAKGDKKGCCKKGAKSCAKKTAMKENTEEVAPATSGTK